MLTKSEQLVGALFACHILALTVVAKTEVGGNGLDLKRAVEISCLCGMAVPASLLPVHVVTSTIPLFPPSRIETSVYDGHINVYGHDIMGGRLAAHYLDLSSFYHRSGIHRLSTSTCPPRMLL